MIELRELFRRKKNFFLFEEKSTNHFLVLNHNVQLIYYVNISKQQVPNHLSL